MNKKEYIEAFQCGKSMLKVGEKEYHPGDIIPTLGEVTPFVLQQMLDGGRLFRVLVVTPSRLKQLLRNAA